MAVGVGCKDQSSPDLILQERQGLIQSVPDELIDVRLIQINSTVVRRKQHGAEAFDDAEKGFP